MVPESDYRELEHKNGQSQEECLDNTAELALIKAETPQIIANMACQKKGFGITSSSA